MKPAQVLGIELFEEENRAVVSVAEDQQSLAIGRGGQNVRLAARLTGWKIDIRSAGGEQVAEAGAEGAEEKSAFEVTKKEIAGDDDEAKDTGDANMEPQAQDRDIADEKIEEQQEEPVEKEVDAVEEKPTEETSKE